MPLVSITSDRDSVERPPAIAAPESDLARDATRNYRRHRHDATAEPTAADDWTEGYGIGSQWLYGAALWICTDPSKDAAVWKKVGSAPADANYVVWPTGDSDLSNERPMQVVWGMEATWSDSVLWVSGTNATYDSMEPGVAAFDSDDFTLTGPPGIIVSLKNAYAAEDHDASHIRGGADEVDGDLLDIGYSETNYTPATDGVATHVDHLAAHLEGIDDMLALLRRQQRVWCLKDPEADDEFILCQVPDNVTIKRISYICIGASSTCTLNLYEHSEATPEASGAAVLASAASVTTTLGSTTTFDNASLDQYDHLRCKIISVGDTTPTRVYVGVTFETNKPS